MAVAEYAFWQGQHHAPELEGIIDDSKVTDHHAILPTVEMARTDLSSLPAGERDVLMLLACRLLCATAQPHRFEAVLAVLESEGYTFTAKGKTVLHEGWKGIEQAFRASLKQKQPEDGDENTSRLPELKEGQRFEKADATIRKAKPARPSIILRILCLRLWRQPVRRICRRTPNGKAGYFGHPCRHTGKAGVHGICPAEKETAFAYG